MEQNRTLFSSQKKLIRAPYSDELEKLRSFFVRAESAIINILGYKKNKNLVTYGHAAQLLRVQKVLQDLIDASWEHVPNMVYEQYIIAQRKMKGQINAESLTTTQHAMLDVLTQNLMADITEASVNVITNIDKVQRESILIGRREADVFRKAVLEEVSASEAGGLGLQSAQKNFLDQMKNQGIVAFTDKVGRNWSLRAYADMATRTTSRQASNLGTIFADENHDLYQMTSHGTTCGLCAPLEGRVYSRSGTDKYYPPLASAFGKVDKDGADTIDNTYLNIHPNCLHSFIKFTENGRSEAELWKIRNFSSYASNPPDVDPRSEKQIKDYRNKQQGRARFLGDMKQFEKYRIILGDKFPKTFQTFQKHKLANSEKYQKWIKDYRETNKKLKNVGGS